MKTSASFLSSDLNANPHPLEIVRGVEKSELQQELRRKVSERAYELFEHGGSSCGHDLDHWLQAEKEILHRISEVRSAGSWVIVNLHVPNVPAEGFRLLIGEDQALIQIEAPAPPRREPERKRPESAAFYTARWPGHVDPKTASAYVKNGTLTLEVKLTTPPSGR